MHRTPTVRLALLGLLALCFPAATPLRAQQNLQLELKEIAREIEKLLTLRGQQMVTIKPFQCKNEDFEANSGAGFAQMLSDELLQLGIKDQADARYSVRDDYVEATHEKTMRLLVNLDVRVFDRDNPLLH